MEPERVWARYALWALRARGASIDASGLSERLQAWVQEDRALALRVTNETLTEDDARVPALAAAWDAVVGTARAPRRGTLRVTLRFDPDVPAAARVEALRGAQALDPGVVASAVEERPAAEVRWGTPLRVGLLANPGPVAVALKGMGITNVVVAKMGGEEDRCDLLVVDDPSPDLSAMSGWDVSVVLWRCSDPWAAWGGDASALLRAVHAAGLVIFSAERAERWGQSFLIAEFLRGFGAAAGPDHAAWRLSQSPRVSAVVADLDPRLLARRYASYRRAVPARRFARSPDGLRPFGIRKTSAGHSEEGDVLDPGALESLHPSTRPSPRWLQTRMSPEGLVPGRVHVIEVFIGEREADAHAGTVPFVEPDDDGAAAHQLLVMLHEPRCMPRPASAWLTLPARGRTATLTFPVAVPADVREVAARVVVTHRGRTLQSGVLRADAHGARFEVDARVAGFEALGAHRRVDATFVVNENLDGARGVYAVVDERPLAFSVTEALVEGVLKELRASVEILEKPEGERIAVTDDVELTEVFCDLALEGRGLLDAITSEMALNGERLDALARVQVVTTKIGAFFPAEWLYLHEKPDAGARMCPHAVEAIAQGCKARGGGGCLGACDAIAVTSRVCPLAFVGMSKVVERHEGAVQGAPEDVVLTDGFTSSAAPLELAGGVLVGASSRVPRNAPFDALMAALATRVGEAATATDWANWRQQVQASPRSLLVVLAHHDVIQERDALEIDGSSLEIRRLTKRDVTREGAARGGIALLLGCETAFALRPLQEAMRCFRIYGAPIVVGTVVGVGAERAVEAADAITRALDELLATREEVRFGEALLAVRRSLLAKGNGIALALTSLGDADWLLRRTCSTVTPEVNP